MNRTLPGGTDRVFLPEQRIGLGAAINAYTSGSAYLNHADDSGRIAPGHRADLVVLDRNPFDAPAAEIAEARVTMTFVAGDRVLTA